MVSFAEKIKIVARQCVDIIIDHYDDILDQDDENKSKFSAAVRRFIGNLKSINLRALNKTEARLVLQHTFLNLDAIATTNGVTGDKALVVFESNLSLLIKLRSLILISFTGDDLERLIELFAKANVVGSLTINEVDDTISRYVTVDDLQQIANEDVVIVVIWLFHLLSLKEVTVG